VANAHLEKAKQNNNTMISLIILGKKYTITDIRHLFLPLNRNLFLKFLHIFMRVEGMCNAIIAIVYTL